MTMKRTHTDGERLWTVMVFMVGDYSNLERLAPLKGNVGDQNYTLPADVDVRELRSVVLWCERFSVAFCDAPLVVG